MAQKTSPEDLVLEEMLEGSGGTTCPFCYYTMLIKTIMDERRGINNLPYIRASMQERIANFNSSCCLYVSLEKN